MTTMEEIYDNFLSKISDYSYLSPMISEQDIKDELFGYFKTARAKFYRCKSSLEVVENEFDELEFTVELHPMEIEVLTTLMLVQYLKPQLITSKVLEQSLSDKDFKIHSQANQLREIRLLHNTIKAEASKLITEYTYLDLNLDGDK